MPPKNELYCVAYRIWSSRNIFQHGFWEWIKVLGWCLLVSTLRYRENRQRESRTPLPTLHEEPRTEPLPPLPNWEIVCWPLKRFYSCIGYKAGYFKSLTSNREATNSLLMQTHLKCNTPSSPGKNVICTLIQLEGTAPSHAHKVSLCVLGAVGVHTWKGESYPPAARVSKKVLSYRAITTSVPLSRCAASCANRSSRTRFSVLFHRFQRHATALEQHFEH